MSRHHTHNNGMQTRIVNAANRRQSFVYFWMHNVVLINHNTSKGKDRSGI